MARLATFTQVTLDGFFAGPNGEIDWFKDIPRSEDFDRFTHDAAGPGGTLVFGRTTYDMMRSYWPTEQARRDDPQMARVVDENPKLVFSRTLSDVADEPNWRNVTVERELSAVSVRRMKDAAMEGLTILGSGSIVQQLSRLGAIDEYALVVVPVLLGRGKALFEGVEKTDLELREARSFTNGLTLLRYAPARAS